MTRADARPRVHLWPLGEAWQWSLSPTATRYPATTPGEGLDRAIGALDDRARKGVVVIVEPLP